jgi:pyruvate dehydrogenase E1 component beta subunit
MADKLTYCEAINLAIIECMREDETTFCYGIGVPDYNKVWGTTNGIIEEFGAARCLDAPISEDSLTGFGLGAAVTGSRPIFIHIRVDFLMLAMNQLTNAVNSYNFGNNGKQSAPLTIRAAIGRGWGQGYQHSKTMFSTFAHVPGLEVYAPVSVSDAYYQTKKAIRSNNPSILLEHRWLYWNKGEILDEQIYEKQNGIEVFGEAHDLTIFATSWMVAEANVAKNKLSEQGLSVGVVSVSDLKAPLPDKVGELVEKSGRVLVADNDWRYCGFGAELASQIHENYFSKLKQPVVRLGFKDTHCPTARNLENAFYCDANDIINAIGEMFGERYEKVDPKLLFSHENKFRGPF